MTPLPKMFEFYQFRDGARFESVKTFVFSICYFPRPNSGLEFQLKSVRTLHPTRSRVKM